MQPIIGIMATIHELHNVPGFTHLDNNYVLPVSMAGGVPIVIPTHLTDAEADRIVDLCDGFLFSGGIDISPSFFGEDAHAGIEDCHYGLDLVQFTLIKKVLAARKPLLGICRGEQLLNVACGGTLYQDLGEQPGVFIKHRQQTPFRDVAHRVTIAEDSELAKLLGTSTMVNSYHHQAVKEAGEGVRITAYSADHVAEAIELPDYPFAVGVQWHPERMVSMGDRTMLPLFEKLIEAAQNTNL